MTFASAPEQYIILVAHGPSHITQLITHDVDALIQTTFLPFWWLWPKKTLQLLEPYVGFAIYGATISTVLVSLRHFDEWFGDKSLAQQKEEFVAKRKENATIFQDQEKVKAQALANTLNSRDVSNKIDTLSTYVLQPSTPEKLRPIDEIFPKDHVLHYLGFMFLAFCVAGILHMLLLQIYQRLTPPSLIAVGRLGRRRLRLYEGYNWIGITLSGAALLWLIHSMYKFALGFFES